jgi:hypothetical protein
MTNDVDDEGLRNGRAPTVLTRIERIGIFGH